MKRAAFSLQAVPGDLDYHPDRLLDKAMIGRLLGLDFLRKAENIIITGPTGVGKSYLGQAIGRQACQMLFKTRYFVTARFLTWPKELSSKELIQTF